MTFLPPATANTFRTLEPDMKVNYPSPSQRKKRFSKIRQIIEDKSGKNTRGSTKDTGTLGGI